MKKIISVLLLLLLALSLFAGCAKKQTTSNDQTPAESPSSSASSPQSDATDPSKGEAFPEDGVVTATKDGSTVQVSLAIPSYAKKHCSLLLLTDTSYQYSWADAPAGVLCDLGQLTLDDKGNGSATLKAPEAIGTVYLVVTTESGAFTTVTIN